MELLHDPSQPVTCISLACHSPGGDEMWICLLHEGEVGCCCAYWRAFSVDVQHLLYAALPDDLWW